MAKRRLKSEVKNTFGIILILLLIIVGGYLTFNTYLSENKPQKKKEETKETTTISSEEKPKELSANLTLVGDFLFEQPYYDSLASGDARSTYFQKVKSYFENDDLSIGNMEVVIGNDSLETSGVGYNFCAPVTIGEQVATLDMEVLSTANNHSNDRGQDGISSSIDFFKNNTDILTVGTYKSEEERNQAHIKEVNGIKFGFLAYTYGTNITVTSGLEYTIGLYRNPITKTMTDEYKEKIKKEVELTKQSSDVVIVIMHWGNEFTYNPTDEQKTIAQYLNSLGVDIIIGSHSHCIQPIDIIGDEHKTLVYYSLGNFVSADDDISRAGETFDNAYQVGLLSKLKVTLKDNQVSFNDITTEPIINYYDDTLHHFELVPLSLYTTDYEKTHYRYNMNFNKSFITNMYETVIDSSYRK